MSAVITAFNTFWASWGPWITVGLVPTIIAGLSVSPKTQPEAAWIQRQWDRIKSILQYFSVATFSDHPGTFKLPLTKSGPKKRKNSGVDSGPGSGSSSSGACAALIIAGVAAHNTGCCSWTHSCQADDTAGQIATNTIDCGIASIEDDAARLLPLIMTVLTGNKPDWQAELDSLKQSGTEAFVCALQSASFMLADGSKPGSNEKLTANQTVMSLRVTSKDAHNKAEQYYTTVGKIAINVKRY